MANLMGVTNPVPGYDGPNNTRVQPTAIRPGDTSIQKRIEYDLYYIENWTLGLDIKILFMTIYKGFKNAY